MTLADDPQLDRLIHFAKSEDLGRGDITSALLPHPRALAEFHLVAREPGVFAGQEVAGVILRAYDAAIELTWMPCCADGAVVEAAPVDLATIRGPVASVLSAERVLLNFLQRLCGVATVTRRYVDAVAGTGATVLDTRKTIPGWRALDRYAVRSGGGVNHRRGLDDAVLIKDNHLANVPPDRLAGAVFEMLNRLSGDVKPSFVEVEAETPAQVEALLNIVGIDVILLDNFAPGAMREAVTLRDELGLAGKVALEASGGITLETVRQVAQTGVDRISVGALTHSAVALDLALDRV